MNASSTAPITVFDSNITVSGLINPSGSPWEALTAWEEGACRAISSDDLHGELAEVLTRPELQVRFRAPARVVARVLAGLSAARVPSPAVEALPVHCRDPKDDRVLACALGGGADYIVTGDADLLALDGHPALGALRIVLPAAFLAIVREREPKEAQ